MAKVKEFDEQHLAKAAKAGVAPADYVPTKEKLAYSCGALMDGGGVALMACVLLKYMTDSLGIVAATASTIMMVSKIWDAITDPVMGFITDNTRSKYGRRKPYMFIGGIALIFAIFMLFSPIKDWGITSQGGMVAWVLIWYLFWNTCSTCSQVPYTSMASDISPAFSERNNANTFKLVFSSVASGLAYVVPLLLLSSYQKGSMSATGFWLVMAILFGGLFGGGLVVTALFAKERVKPAPGEKKQKFNLKDFLKGYVTPYKNKSYAWHIAMYVAAFTCMDMLSALAAYYADHVWRGVILDLGFIQMPFGSMFIVAPMMVAAVIAFPLVRVVMDKKGKAFAFRMGLPLYIIGGILIAVMDPAWCPPIVVPIAAFIMGFGFGGAQMIPWMNFPDTLDVAELKLGERPTGNYSGMMTLVRKVSGALGVGIIGWVLTGVGYDSYSAAIEASKELAKQEGALQTAYNSASGTTISEFFRNFGAQITGQVNTMETKPAGFDILKVADGVDTVLLTIRLLMGVAIAVLIAFALFSSFKFRLTNPILARMRYFSEKVKAGEYDTLTEEEKEERIALINKHYGKYNAEEDAEMIARLKKAVEEERAIQPEEEPKTVSEETSVENQEIPETTEE